jgi:RecB family endonuclease NucS
MPLELSVWRIDSGLSRVEPSTMDLEARLEGILARDIGVAAPNWMVIGRQVPTPWGKLIDLLCIDAEGNLVVLELKRHKTEREIVAQVLDYGSYVRAIQAEEVPRIYAK